MQRPAFAVMSLATRPSAAPTVPEILMFVKSATLILVSSLHLASAAEVAAVPVAPASDRAQVVTTIERMYVALTNDNLTLFDSVIATGFYAFDGGKRFDGDALMELIKSLHAAGKVYVWNVTEPSVELFGDNALITYVNRGSLQDPSGKKELSWLESALLRKEQGIWRIRFFHSTRVP
jgi:hypothetical protein